MGKILGAALELFSSHGYEYTSMSQIARQAGISKGLIYNYFDSKEELLKAMIDHAQESVSDRRETFLQVFNTSDPRAAMEDLFRIYFSELRHHAEFRKMFTALSLQLEKFDFIHDLALTKLHKYYELLEDTLAGIGYPNPKQETKLLAATLEGIGLHYLIIREDYPLDEIETFLIEKYCRYEK